MDAIKKQNTEREDVRPKNVMHLWAAAACTEEQRSHWRKQKYNALLLAVGGPDGVKSV